MMRIYLRRAVLNKLQLRRRRRSIFVPFRLPNPLFFGLFHHLDSSQPPTSIFRVSTYSALFLPSRRFEGSLVWDYKDRPSDTYRRRKRNRRIVASYSRFSTLCAEGRTELAGLPFLGGNGEKGKKSHKCVRETRVRNIATGLSLFTERRERVRRERNVKVSYRDNKKNRFLLSTFSLKVSSLENVIVKYYGEM